MKQETIDVLKSYMDLYEISKKESERFLNRPDIQLYCLLRDKLTYPELVDLQISINNICNNEESMNKIDFREYLFLNDNDIQRAMELFNIDKKGNIINNKKFCAIATIISMEPKNIIDNFLINY